MPEREGFGPWRELRKLVEESPGKRNALQHHPADETLRAYLKKELPEHPVQWTIERARALAEGTVPDWTSWEIGAHLGACARCRRQVERLEKRLVPLARVRPHPAARLAWALAGLEALALVGLALWIGLFSSPPTKLPNVPQLPNWATSVQTDRSAVWVKFAPEATAADVTALLSSLHLAVGEGPDEEGYFEVSGEGAAMKQLTSSEFVSASREERR